MAPTFAEDNPGGDPSTAGRKRLLDEEELEDEAIDECAAGEKLPEETEEGDDQNKHNEGGESAGKEMPTDDDEACTWAKASKQTLTTGEIATFLQSRCQQKLCSGPSSCNTNKPISGFSSLQWSKKRGPRICLVCEGGNNNKANDNGKRSKQPPPIPHQKSPVRKKQKVIEHDGEDVPSKFMFGEIPRNDDIIANNDHHLHAMATGGDNAALSAADALSQSSKCKSNNAQQKRSSSKKGSKSNNKQNALDEKDATDDDGEDYDILPKEVERNKNGQTPFGKIRSCMCSNPGLCREILWRWARLQEGKYISYLNLPHTLNPQTPVGQHILAYREAFMRKLGYSAEGGEGQVERILRKGGGRNKQTCISSKMNSEERLAIIHFHPAMHPYILEDRDNKFATKVSKWRIPIDVGRNIELKEEDKCPTKDPNDAATYFAVPTYDLKNAEADVKRAERQFRHKYKEQREQNEHYRQQMKDDPAGVVVELSGMKLQNDNLRKENEELKERIQRELHKQNDIEKKCQKLHKGLEKVARHLRKWENTNTSRRRPKDCANEIYKDATGMNINGNHKRHFVIDKDVKRKAGSGGKRWSDPRMDKAVRARLDDPQISTEEALRIGGFEFQEIDSNDAVSQRDIFDADNVSMQQRKNNLHRRLRHVANMDGEANGAAAGGAGDEDGNTSEGNNALKRSDPRMDKAIQAKLDNPNISNEEALCLGGYVYSVKKGVSQKDLVDMEGISLTQRKNSLRKRMKRIELKKQKCVASGPVAASQEDVVARKPNNQDGLETEYGDEDDGMELREATVDDLV